GRRVLVTGHSGFKAAWLSSWLLADGVEVAGVALAPESHRPRLYDDLDLATRMLSTIGAIRDLSTVEGVFQAFRPPVVFHLAAQALVRRSYADPLGTFASNVMGTAHVLEAARSCDSVKAPLCVPAAKVSETCAGAW